MRIKISLAIGVMLLSILSFIPAFSQTVTVSYAYLDVSALTGAQIDIIENHVRKRTSENGGKCKAVSEKRRYFKCTQKKRSVQILHGFTKEGDYVLGVKTTISHFFAVKEEDVISGKHLSDEHLELERWIKDITREMKVEKYQRTYAAYDYSVTF